MRLHATDSIQFLIGLLALFLGLACARIAAPEGWSGGLIADNKLYIGTAQGEILALDLDTGDTVRKEEGKLWKFSIPEREGEERSRSIYGTPAISNNTLFVGGYDGVLYALSLDLNDIKGTERLGGSIVGGPSVADNIVIVGSSDGNLYAFDVTEEIEGRVIFNQKWRFSTGHKIWSRPVVSGDAVYFGSMDHNIYALALETGDQLWKFETEGAIVASPLILKDRLFVGSFDRNFYSIDSETGEEIWRFTGASNWFWGQAVISEMIVFAPSLDGNLYALDIETGALRWTLSTKGPIVGSPVVVFDMIAVPSGDEKIRLATLHDGDAVGDCNVGKPIITPLVENEGVIYFGVRDGSIRALKIKPSGNPDEVWVRFTDKNNAEPKNRILAC